MLNSTLSDLWKVPCLFFRPSSTTLPWPPPPSGCFFSCTSSFACLPCATTKRATILSTSAKKNLILYGSIAFVVAGGTLRHIDLSYRMDVLAGGSAGGLYVGTLIGVIIYNFLEYYYPTLQEKRLQRLRYKPRTSPKSGKPMKLLSENEEDVHLDEGQQAEENIFSVDYDVWVDEASDYVKIEKYPGPPARREVAHLRLLHPTGGARRNY